MNEQTQSPDMQIFAKLVFPPVMIDGEKILYAVSGVMQNVNKLRQQEDCNNLADKILTEITDSREVYNLNNAEFLQAFLILYDRISGIPADIIKPVITDSRINIEKTFNVNVNELRQKAISRYKEIFGSSQYDIKSTQPDILTGFDKIIEILMNETGISYKSVIAVCLDIIRSQDEVIYNLKTGLKD